MTPHIIEPAAYGWESIHADWWENTAGDTIHRIRVDDAELYHYHLAGSHLPWNDEAETLSEAMLSATTLRTEIAA